jgi:hypothetical protein
MERLTTRVRSLYLRQRTPVALILVSLITVASILDNSPLQLTAGLALLGLILQVLFEIEEKVTGSRTTTWYPTFQEALPHMSDEIERRLRRGLVRMRWIGVTQEAGWPFSQNLLIKILDGHFGKAACLQVELAAIDPDGEICRRPNGPDRDQVRSTKDRISRFVAAWGTQLVDRNSAIALYLYDHRPTWHALLVDDDTLFYSTAMPQNLPFASPQGGVEVVKIDGEEQDVERIRHFIAWFKSIALDARNTGRAVSSQSAKSGTT